MILLNICALIFITTEVPQEGVCTEQAFFLRNEKKYLANHVIETKQAESELECGLHCVADGSCASVNYKTSGISKGRCELNCKTLGESSDDETHDPEFTYLAVTERVSRITKRITHGSHEFKFILSVFLSCIHITYTMTYDTAKYIYKGTIGIEVCGKHADYHKDISFINAQI